MHRYGYDTDSHSEEERKEEPEERRTSLTELGIKITSFIMPTKTSVYLPPPLFSAIAFRHYLLQIKGFLSIMSLPFATAAKLKKSNFK